jgi:rubrerythrin
MIKGKEDLLQSLIDAFLMEKGTKEFYSHASEKAVNSDTRNMFKDLSVWEGKHMDFIQILYQSVIDDRELKSFEEFKNKTKSPVSEAGIPVKDLEAKIEKYSFTDENGALIFAMEIEGKAYNLYRKLSENSVDKNAQVVFKEMMAQEVGHINHLKELRVRLLDVYKPEAK